MRTVLALLVIGALAGCTGSGQADGPSPPGRALDITPVAPQDTTHAEEGLRMVREDGRVRLEVYGGKQPTGGYSVNITGVRRDGDTIIVHAVLETPGADAVVTPAFSYPADAVTFPLERGAYRVRLHLARGNTTRTTERTVILR